jgi:hypothetical protein
MGLADGFRESDYLIKYYIESSQALWAYENYDNVKALDKAAAIYLRSINKAFR